MGGLCSKSSSRHDGHTFAKTTSGDGDADDDRYQSSVQKKSSNLTTPQTRLVQEQEQEEVQQPIAHFETYGTTGPDDFYDGIPRYNATASLKSRSIRSKQAAVAKVSEVSSRLGRAGTAGLGKAVEVLDTLGSSMTNLNSGSGFISGTTTKGNEIGILSFEVANTIMKGSTLMQSLSKRSIRQLKEVVLPSDAVQNLVSEDMDELLRIFAADKREELKIFSGEVVRFGNHCKDPQWHELDRYFEKISRKLTPQKQLREEADSVMQQLMTLVRSTAELYHEMHSLDRFEQDYMRKRQEEEKSLATYRGDNVSIIRSERKSQRKQVKLLKKKSLWSRSMEEVMEKLVDIIHFLHLEIHNAFGSSDGCEPADESPSSHQRLGPSGLALHYANIVIQIDTLVLRSSSVAQNLRDALYQNLPPSLKSAIRSKVQSFHVKEELTVTDIKAEMEKTLQWLVPIATNTAKAHHGFGWVGEWAGTGSEVNRKPTVQTDIIQIETLHHADKEKTEAYILDLVVWLHHLISRSKSGTSGSGMKPPTKSPISTSLLTTTEQPKDVPTNGQLPMVTIEEQEMLQCVNKKRWTPGISKSQNFDHGKTRLKKHNRLSKSCSSSPTRGSKELLPCNKISELPVIVFGVEKEHALDVIDRVDVLIR